MADESKAAKAEHEMVVLASAITVKVGKAVGDAVRFVQRQRFTPTAAMREHGNLDRLEELGAIAPADQKGNKALTARDATLAAGADADPVAATLKPDGQPVTEQ